MIDTYQKTILHTIVSFMLMSWESASFSNACFMLFLSITSIRSITIFFYTCTFPCSSIVHYNGKSRGKYIMVT